MMRYTSCWIAAVLFLAACSGYGKPDGKTEVERQIQDQSGGLIQLISYEKTNGMEQGDSGYTVFYSARIEFTDDCIWSGDGHLNMGKNFGALRATEQEYQYARNHMYSSQLGHAVFMGWKPVHKDQTADIAGQIAFVRTDNGWMAIPP